MIRIKGRLFILSAIFSVVLAGCVVSRSPITGNKRAYGYTWQQEIELGRESDQQILAQYGTYDDPGLLAYVDSLGQALLEVSHLRRAGADPEWAATEFHFRILDSPVINAFALPGGYVYVTRGLLAHLENEAQLAVVLGHEIGHVAGRHASKRAATQMGGSLVLLGAAVGGQILGGGDTGESILNLGGTAAQLLFLSYSREDERESDRLGVEYASMVGYRAAEASHFFTSLKRLGEQAESSIPSFLSTHPDPGEREKRIGELAAEWSDTYRTDRIAHAYYLNRVNRIVYGENPRNGFVSGGYFHHPDLAFEFPVPDGYTVINQARQILLVASDQAAVVQMMIDDEHDTAAAASDAFVAQEGIQLVERGLGTANNLSARYVLADAQTEQGEVLRLRAHFTEYSGRVFAFLGVAQRNSFSSYDSQFQQVMRGFRPVSAPAILNVQPNRIAVAHAGRTAAFASLLPSTLPQQLTPLDLAILNQVELDDVMTAGEAYKTVR
jgi:predicted Zn-dependent protease